MAVIKLSVMVPDIDTVRSYFDFIKIYRSTTGIDGVYTEITGVGTRIALEDGVTVYSYTDTAGDEGYYYKSSFYNSTSALESSLSDPQEGEGDPALDVISVDELKSFYLFGLDLTDDEGTEYPTELYEHFIRSAVSAVEHKLDIPIIPRTIPDERHDFIRDDYENFVWLELDVFPVINVETVKMVMPGEQLITEFDQEWFQLQKESGQLQLVPGTGTANLILLGTSGAYLPFIYGTRKMIPNVFRIKYTAGFPSGEVPAVIKDLVAKVACFGPLNIAGDLVVGAGIATTSLSIDGLSQSISSTSSATNAGYGARLLQYSKEIKEIVPTLLRYYKGLRLRVA